MSSVCLSRTFWPKSRTERPRKTTIGTEVAHVTHDSNTTFKVKKSKVKITWSISPQKKNVPFFAADKLRSSNFAYWQTAGSSCSQIANCPLSGRDPISKFRNISIIRKRLQLRFSNLVQR